MSDDLIEDVYVNRPEDDDLAFVYYERFFSQAFDKALREIESDESYNNSYNHYMQTYINQVLATVRALNIQILKYWIESPATASDERNFRQIKFDIDAAITEIKIQHAQISRKYSVRLDNTTREKIRDLINKIKITIESIDLPILRKESLINKLNAFAADVDRDRTKFEAFGALVVEASGIANRVERKLRPIRKWIDSIGGVMREAKTMEDTQHRLPESAKRIEGSSKQIEPPSGKLWTEQRPPKEKNLDDDIPF
jgi:hypothetical protein